MVVPGGDLLTIPASKCPKCGSHLLYEEVGNYGDVYDILVQTGKPAKKRKSRVHYEHEDTMVYCLECGSNYEHKLIDGKIWITFTTEDFEV